MKIKVTHICSESVNKQLGKSNPCSKKTVLTYDYIEVIYTNPKTAFVDFLNWLFGISLAQYLVLEKCSIDVGLFSQKRRVIHLASLILTIPLLTRIFCIKICTLSVGKTKVEVISYFQNFYCEKQFFFEVAKHCMSINYYFRYFRLLTTLPFYLRIHRIIR